MTDSKYSRNCYLVCLILTFLILSGVGHAVAETTLSETKPAIPLVTVPVHPENRYGLDAIHRNDTSSFYTGVMKAKKRVFMFGQTRSLRPGLSVKGSLRKRVTL